MYSHGKNVDLSSIHIVYIGARELGTKLKQCIESNSIHMVGNSRNVCAVLVPVPRASRNSRAARSMRRVELRQRFAAVIDKLTL